MPHASARPTTPTRPLANAAIRAGNNAVPRNEVAVRNDADHGRPLEVGGIRARQGWAQWPAYATADRVSTGPESLRERLIDNDRISFPGLEVPTLDETHVAFDGPLRKRVSTPCRPSSSINRTW